MKRFATLFVVMFLATSLVALPAYAGESCHKINASGSGTSSGVDPIVIESQIQGGGLLQGTVAGTFSDFDFSGLPVFGFSGPLTFTTNRGTVTFDVAGELDLVTELGFNDGPVSASTGKLAGATGYIEVDLVSNLAAGTFTQAITGEICVDLQGNGKR